MGNIRKFHARVCLCSTAFLVHQERILLIQHKKLGIWLAPGGHIEADELPHEAAERECLEETGIRVKAVSPIRVIDSSIGEYFPVPFFANLHWISRENFDARITGKNPNVPHATPLWPRGCEQHLGYAYLVVAEGSIFEKHNPDESTAISWFSKKDIPSLDTIEDVKQEIYLAMDMAQDLRL